jgi:hypothetical protein
VPRGGGECLFCYYSSVDLKREFVESYRDRILVHFDYDLFLRDDGITLASKNIPLRQFLDFYTPWYEKGGLPGASIETVLADRAFRSVRIKDVLRLAEKDREIRSLPGLPDRFWPVPIATDTSLGKSLLLDSNKTISALVHLGKRLEELIPVVEISGRDLQRLNSDFKVLARDP